MTGGDFVRGRVDPRSTWCIHYAGPCPGAVGPDAAVLPWLEHAGANGQRVGAIRTDLPSDLLISVVMGIGPGHGHLADDRTTRREQPAATDQRPDPDDVRRDPAVAAGAGVSGMVIMQAKQPMRRLDAAVRSSERPR